MGRCHHIRRITQCILISLLWSVSTIWAQPRIITLSPHATELIQAIGGEHLLVAAAAHSTDLPESIPRLNTFGGIDRERILQLAPDLVIAWTSGNRPSDLAWLTAQDIHVFHSEPSKLYDLAEQMHTLGTLTGLTNSAEQAAQHFLQALRNNCSRPEPTTVYLSLWDRPAMTIGGRHWLNDVLHHAGLRNTYRSVRQSVFTVEAEAHASQQKLPRLSSQPGSSHISLPDLSRPSPALIHTIHQLCQHPPVGGAR